MWFSACLRLDFSLLSSTKAWPRDKNEVGGQFQVRLQIRSYQRCEDKLLCLFRLSRGLGYVP